MLEVVARDLAGWLAMGLPVDHIGVNVSLADFHGGRLDQQIAAAHALHGLSLDHLVIEISESAYTALRDASVIAAIEALRAQGVRLALDDFGTGGGMLMPLLTMPVDVIKIDKILIDRLAPGGAGSAVIGGLLHTARNLGVTVIAEGVENEAQAIQLRHLGCQMGQGYFFSRPMDRQAATDLLASCTQGRIARSS
jgi:EAL domain-containing protein (putative c-di-GMP-specific phosphodiesterase class I)